MTPGSQESVYWEWYNEEQWHAGEFEHYPKNHSRIPEFHEEVRLTDLKPFIRQAGKFGLHILPAARLWRLGKQWFIKALA